jgi:hypothetical protein
MKTTVELPDKILSDTREYAVRHGKTFKDVLTDALKLLVYDQQGNAFKSGWESLFGAFAGDPDNTKIQAAVDEEFSLVDHEGWE